MDDVTLSDILSIRRAIDLTDWYSWASGAKLNRSKSEAQVFGPWEGVHRSGLDVNFKETDFKTEVDRKTGLTC